MTENIEQLSPLQRAVLALKEMRAKLEKVEKDEKDEKEPIAIIGMGCRFPGGADNPNLFWQLLHDGVDATTEFPTDRWDIEKYYDADPNKRGKIYARKAGFLKNIDQFSPEFFRISPREAEDLDPQQRLLLEVCWEALENAGQVPEQGSQTGVFVGMGQNDYAQLKFYANAPEQIDTYDGTGNGFCFASGRLSYVLGLQGPSMTIDTACSSSLVTVHLACQSLRAGESDLALAGGVQLMLSPEVSIFLSRAKALSPDGRCKTFDAAADGYGRGEGCGMVVLKRLSDAIADGDNILALIRGSMVNHDGASSGLTVPNGQAQQALIRQALKNAQVKPAEVSYVEAHGTGTALGDPVEVNALGAAFGKGRSEPLLIGSVKTNIGHLEAAAGIAGLIKVVLSLQHEEIPPHLHFKQPSSHIPWDKLPVEVPTLPTKWSSLDTPRIAGISSFGISGTNAHIVLEEAPKIDPSSDKLVERPLHLLTLSAQTENALKQLAQSFTSFNLDNVGIGDICFTANVGRNHHDYRLSLATDSVLQMQDQLLAFIAGEEICYGKVQDKQKIAFLCTGQGSQYIGMGRVLYETQAGFRKTFDHCAEILTPYLEKSLLSVINDQVINETAYTQPALFALEYSLAKLWQSWGIQPSIVMGHSVGEYVAACIAGVFSLEDGLKLIAARGRLMQTLCDKGDMLVLSVDESKAREIIQAYAQDVSIAAINGPENVVISGKSETIKIILAKIEKNIKAKLLTVSHAFHSPMMEPMLVEFERIAAEVTYSIPKIPLCSNVTGQLATEEIATPAYWVRHVRQPVRFAASMETLSQQAYDIFIEIGPKPSLLGMGRMCISKGTWLVSLRKGQDDWQQILQSLGELYVRGVSVDWASFDRDYSRSKVPLPTYPFQRESYWVDKSIKRKQATNKKDSQFHPLLGQQLHSAALKNGEIQFESEISQDTPAFIKDHCVHQTVVLPGTAYLEMALSAGAIVFNSDNLVLEDVIIQQALFLPDSVYKTLQLILTPNETGKYAFQIFSLKTDEYEPPLWIIHASGKVLVDSQKTSKIDLNALQARITEAISIPDLYQHYRDIQMDYGSSFQAVQRAWRSEGEALGEICLPEHLIFEADNYNFHPAFLDSCTQILGSIFDYDAQTAYMPVAYQRLSVFARPSTQLWSHAKIHSIDELNQETLTAEVCLFTSSGQVVATIEGFILKQASREALLDTTANIKNWLYEIVWRQHKEQTLLPIVGRDAPLYESRTWIIFADTQGIGEQLATGLRAIGGICILVFSGESYEQISEQTFKINPTSSEDFERLLNHLNTQSVDRIVHFWSLDSVITDLEMANNIGCIAVLHLVQSLVKIGFSKPLWLITSNSQAVGLESTPLSLAQSPLWGLGRVIALEHPELWGGMIDLASQPETDEISMLLSELLHSTDEDHIAFRNKQSYVARLVHSNPQDSQKIQFQSDSTYLITGGLGFLGLKLASWMVRQGAQHLVLTGRREFPKRDTWANISENTDTWKQIQAIQRLEENGASVLVLQADVSDFEQMSWVFEQVKMSQFPMRGIIHAAGVGGIQAISDLTANALKAMFSSKITGAWFLHQLTQNMDMDFFVCFSSISAVWGSKWQAHYAAANHFLDILAHHRRAIGLPALTINWGLLVGGGMGDNEEYIQWLDKIGVEGFYPEQGFLALDYLLGSDAVQTTIAKVNWNRFKALYEARQPRPLLEEIEVEENQEESKYKHVEVEILQSLKELPASEHETLLTNYLQQQVAKTLHLSPSRLNVQQPLNKMGLDSLMMMELRNRMVEELDVEIPMVKLMGGVSVIELVTEIKLQLKEVQSPTTSVQQTIIESLSLEPDTEEFLI